MAQREHTETVRQRLSAALRGDGPAGAATLAALLDPAGPEGVAPLLRERLLELLPANSAQARTLRDLALREAALELRRNMQVRVVLDALAAAGVPALVFKGTALAHSHYPRPELRPRDDTDLLVDPRHLEAAAGVLHALGFEPVPGVEGALIMRQRLYRRRDGDGVLHNVDLHWAVSNSARAAALAPRALLARARPLPALGAHAAAPCDVDALLLACLHLDAHHAGDVRLMWLEDVHLLVADMDLCARVGAADRAAMTGLAGACAWVLAAARDALGTPLDGFQILAEAGPVRAPSPHRAAGWLRDLEALPDTRTRAAWLVQHAFPPAAFMRSGGRDDTPLWRLYLARALRGLAHLSRR